MAAAKKDWWTSMGPVGKAAVILISIAAILWAAYVKAPKVAEGFFQVDCSKFTGCKECADVGGCVWCPDQKKCSNADRVGFPTDTTCDKNSFVTFSDRCDPVPQPTPPPSSGGSGEEPAPPVAPNCPSTVTIVEDVLKTLDPTIKATVKREMNAYGVPLIEGFQGQEAAIAAMSMGPVRDAVAAMVRRSLQGRASLAPAPAPASL